MASPGGSTNPSKMYQFISDPGHKENLSGRVRAACITCRRKKIKCSGTAPCVTCTEKGVTCEGLTIRKKPKRFLEGPAKQSSSSSMADALSTTSALQRRHSQGRASSSTDPSSKSRRKRPTDQLVKLQTNSNDSGYFSAQHSFHDEAAFSQPSSVGLEFSMSPQSMYVDSTVSTPLFTDWNIPRRTSSDAQRNTIASTTHSSPHVTNDLISAAELLEEQAQSLRHLAMQQQGSYGVDTRRQTITLPLQTDSSISPNYPGLYQHAAFDDLSLLMPERYSASSFTPSGTSYDNWWNFESNPSAMYGFPMGPSQVGPPFASADGQNTTGQPWSVPDPFSQEALDAYNPLAPQQQRNVPQDQLDLPSKHPTQKRRPSKEPRARSRNQQYRWTDLSGG